MPQYKYTADAASKISKHGIDLVIYHQPTASAEVVHVSVKEGHFEEFYNTKSTFIYYIVEGHGVFVLNDEHIEATATDLIVAPPDTHIHYFGTMEMVLTTTPAFDPADEHHVRFVDKSENPFAKAKSADASSTKA